MISFVLSPRLVWLTGGTLTTLKEIVINICHRLHNTKSILEMQLILRRKSCLLSGQPQESRTLFSQRDSAAHNRFFQGCPLDVVR